MVHTGLHCTELQTWYSNKISSALSKYALIAAVKYCFSSVVATSVFMKKYLIYLITIHILLLTCGIRIATASLYNSNAAA